MSIRVIEGDCRTALPDLPAGSVHCVVTSPPYLGLRDYGTAQWEGGDTQCDHRGAPLQSQASTLAGNGHGNGKRLSPSLQAQAAPFCARCGKCGARRIDSQIGLEATPDDYLTTMVEVFRHVRRVLRDDGTCWVNMGDSYARTGGTDRNVSASAKAGNTRNSMQAIADRTSVAPAGLADKQLLMMPARLALALQADGWWIRSEIVWAKPNPMPESVTDRPTSAHEKIYLLTKAPKYYYDADAVRETGQDWSTGGPGVGIKTTEHYAPTNGGNAGLARLAARYRDGTVAPTRNLRNVWTIATVPFIEAHFATFPPALAERCIKAGCPSGGVVLDPFAGAGTALLVADRLQRDAIGIELNPDYVAMLRARIVGDCPLFAEVGG